MGHKNTMVRNTFSAVVYTTCNITQTIEKAIAAHSVSSENSFRCFYMNEHHWLYTSEFQELHFLGRSRPFQSQTAWLLLHTMSRLQEISLTNFIPGKLCTCI